MRVMVLVKANRNSEAGVMPSTRLLEDMGRFNEELASAGVLLAGEGLHPSSRGARVFFSGARRTVELGPFGEAQGLVAGYWLWEVESMEEALGWAKRCPNPTGEHCELELRPLFEMEDFGAAFTPDLREAEERLRAHAK